jgi:hypothetical protein
MHNVNAQFTVPVDFTGTMLSRMVRDNILSPMIVKRYWHARELQAYGLERQKDLTTIRACIDIARRYKQI